MKLLLTGASGFIGSAVLHRLAADSRHGVVTAGRRPPSPGGSAASARHIVMDARGGADWSAALDGVGTILHLAARAHILHDSAVDPLSAYRAVNTAGALTLAEQAAAAGVRRFVFVSTAKVHGEATRPGRPFNEAMAPAPQDPYALSKWEAEQDLARLATRTGLQVVVVRPPLVYGPGVKANFAALMHAVARGRPLPLAAIDNRRSLISLGNLVDLLLLCLHHPAAANQAFLASDGEDLSTPELIRRLAQAMGKRPRLFDMPPACLRLAGRLLGRGPAVERLCGNLEVDIGKARTLLGWSPPDSVDEGLRLAVQWMPR